MTDLVDLPEGTVTFLFTDVEGSTRLWERHPAAMRAALEAHDALIEGLTAQHGGRLVRPRGEGDSRFCVFRRATDAVAAAAGIQRALHAEPWPPEAPLRVRLALHTGEADLRDGDYYGGAVNRCARLRAIAHGGQALLSMATEELVRDALPAGATLRDLGEHRLADLARPERVFQVLVPGVAADFPPPRSLDARPHNLPLQLTSFVGRECELGQVLDLLAGQRLLTLSGAGGCGKTRLALQAAAEAIDRYPDGVWFVDLAPVAEAALVPDAALAALGAAPLPAQEAAARLAEYLRPRHALLLLDNCEHLLEAAARLADALLRRCPGVRVLATSRELLGLAGETAWRVPSLGLPTAAAGEEGPGPAALEASGAGCLFLDRARAVQPAFALTAANASAVAAVCARLDGIPLALELAAARVRVLTPEQLAARLGDRFRLLTGGGRTALRRQQTLQATVDWSHALLSEAERALFRRLAVFPGGATGGFPLEAAEAVGAGEPVAAADVLDLLAGLVDKSLVLAEARGAEERYRLLETLRQYAEERLLQAGEAAPVRGRHAAWCLALGRAIAAAEASGTLPRRNPARGRLLDERESVRAALGWWASDPAAAPAGLELLAAVGEMGVGETQSESRRWLETFLGLVPARPAARARCLLALDHFLRWEHAFPRALAAAREARELFEALGDADGAASHEGLVAANLGDYARAAALLGACLARARARGDWARVEQHARDLGVAALARRDFAEARARIEESRALAERHRLGSRASLVAMGNLRLAVLDRLEGDLPRARARLEEVRQHVVRLGEAAGGEAAWWQDLLALERARAALGEAGYAAAWAAGRALPLEQAVADALEDAPATA